MQNDDAKFEFSYGFITFHEIQRENLLFLVIFQLQMLFMWTREPTTLMATPKAGPYLAWFTTAVLLWRYGRRFARLAFGSGSTLRFLKRKRGGLIVPKLTSSHMQLPHHSSNKNNNNNNNNHHQIQQQQIHQPNKQKSSTTVVLPITTNTTQRRHRPHVIKVSVKFYLFLLFFFFLQIGL